MTVLHHGGRNNRTTESPTDREQRNTGNLWWEVGQSVTNLLDLGVADTPYWVNMKTTYR